MSTAAQSAPTGDIVEVRPRRTQTERRDGTTRKLLEATIESILDVGYAATTVRSVAKRAGVSPGARSHLFPRRIDLVVATLEYLCADRLSAAQAGIDGLSIQGPARLSGFLDLMWQDYTSDTFVVGMKLWAAAADDAELHARLQPTMAALNASLLQLYGEAIGSELANIPNVSMRMSMVHDLLLGHAFSRTFAPLPLTPKLSDWPKTRAELLRLVLGDQTSSS
ncbi:MAG: TetR/AcrR family transcriptional regulator [Mycobacterium sp.]